MTDKPYSSEAALMDSLIVVQGLTGRVQRLEGLIRELLPMAEAWYKHRTSNAQPLQIAGEVRAREILAEARVALALGEPTCRP